MFLDEMVEFPRQVLEVLRQPLEDGEVVISRSKFSVKYPCNFMLLGAMNPCPCGYLGDKQKQCSCTQFQIDRYKARLSGPLLDRIDLHIESIEHARANIVNDSLCKVLLDKDNCLPDIPESSDRTYWVAKPSKAQFVCTCTEFWWCLNNVAKGLWREEIPYVQDMLNYVVRKQLEKMLSWKVGVITDYSVSVGKSAKYMYKWLSNQEWKIYLRTYCRADINDIWQSVDEMCSLFKETAVWVAEELQYPFNDKEAENCMKFLNAVKNLSKDAKEINI